MASCAAEPGQTRRLATLAAARGVGIVGVCPARPAYSGSEAGRFGDMTRAMTRAQTEPTAAELYFALHAGTPGDAAFYVNAVAGASSALELGCGDGRLSVQLWEHVEELVGLDSDPAALALAAERNKRLAPEANITWVQQDMAELSLGRKFDRVFVPFNTIFCLSGDAAKRACLERARDHLKPGGSLVLDVYAIDALDEDSEGLDPRSEPVEDDFEQISELVCRGLEYEVFERNVWWPSRAELRVDYEFRRGGAPESPRTQTILHSYCSLLHLAALIESLGLECEMGTFQLAEDDAAQQWLRATAPSAPG